MILREREMNRNDTKREREMNRNDTKRERKKH